MIVLIAGTSHSGKTLLAQKLLEIYKYPYLSIDLLKMGLIRSGNTELTPEDDKELETYLWKIVLEIIKTAIENKQNLIVEGGYIPFDWKCGFSETYLNEIRCYFLVMDKNYIENHFSDIKNHADEIERRLNDDWYTKEFALNENELCLNLCQKHNCNYILIREPYNIEIQL